MKSILDKTFLVFDVETTGLAPQLGDRMVEIALIQFRNGKIMRKFETLINPQRPMSYSAYLVHGISDDMLKDAPTSQEILPSLYEWFQESYVVGHNVKFDLKFLNHEYALAGYEQVEHDCTIDTIKMARGFMPQLKKFSLERVANHLGVNARQCHRAMSDVEMTHEVFSQLLEEARQRNLHVEEKFLNLFGKKRIVRQKKREKLKLIENAIEKKETLHLLYSGSVSGTMFRKVSPLKIIGKGRQAVLSGHCHLREQERNFIIDKIVELG